MDRNLTEADVEAVAEKVAEILGAPAPVAVATTEAVAATAHDVAEVVDKVDPAAVADVEKVADKVGDDIAEKVDPLADFFSRFRLQATEDATNSIRSWLLDHFGIRI